MEARAKKKFNFEYFDFNKNVHTPQLNSIIFVRQRDWIARTSSIKKTGLSFFAPNFWNWRIKNASTNTKQGIVEEQNHKHFVVAAAAGCCAASVWHAMALFAFWSVAAIVAAKYLFELLASGGPQQISSREKMRISELVVLVAIVNHKIDVPIKIPPWFIAEFPVFLKWPNISVNGEEVTVGGHC